jgi:hypothetical protein
MRTTEDAVHIVAARLQSKDDSSLEASLKEVMAEPEVLQLAITMIDSAVGPGQRVLFALAVGILIGIEQERNSPR